MFRGDPKLMAWVELKHLFWLGICLVTDVIHVAIIYAFLLLTWIIIQMRMPRMRYAALFLFLIRQFVLSFGPDFWASVIYLLMARLQAFLITGIGFYLIMSCKPRILLRPNKFAYIYLLSVHCISIQFSCVFSLLLYGLDLALRHDLIWSLEILSDGQILHFFLIRKTDSSWKYEKIMVSAQTG